MTNILRDAQEILLDLEAELQLYNSFMPTDNHWLHGATELLECNEIEKWIFDNPPLTDLAQESASKCIFYWKEWLEQSDKYYSSFDEFEIEKPLNNETLFSYIHRIAQIVETEGKGARLEWRALKSFLAYLRKVNSQESAFIEQIFPMKMELFYGRIIRVIPPEVYAIPIEAASQLMRELFIMGTMGRPNGHLSALESFGLGWMCLTASRLRLPTYVEMIEEIKPEVITTFENRSYMLVPTFFGNRKIQISNRMARFLIALSKIPSQTNRETILQSPMRSLTRTYTIQFQDGFLFPRIFLQLVKNLMPL